MAEKCRICGLNNVEHMDDICELCAMTQDPYISAVDTGVDSGSTHRSSRQIPLQTDDEDNTQPAPRLKPRKVILGNPSIQSNADASPSISKSDIQSSVPIYSPGQIPVTTSATTATAVGQVGATSGAAQGPISEGIIKNIHVDIHAHSFLIKWIRALTSSLPFSWYDEVTTFQVFPDYSGSATTLQGNACDQVILYGRIPSGSVSENNDVEIYGRRDSKNNIIAHSVRNRASGTTVIPECTLSCTLVWIITLALLALLGVFTTIYGTAGLVWATVILLCLTHLPTVFKVMGVLFGILLSLFFKRD